MNYQGKGLKKNSKFSSPWKLPDLWFYDNHEVKIVALYMYLAMYHASYKERGTQSILGGLFLGFAIQKNVIIFSTIISKLQLQKKLQTINCYYMLDVSWAPKHLSLHSLNL